MTITATKPVTTTEIPTQANIFGDGLVRVSGSAIVDRDVTYGYTERVYGWVVLGSTMYSSTYYTDLAGVVAPDTIRHQPVGGGWQDYTFYETSRYHPASGAGTRTTHYGLRSDGVLARWASTTTPHLWRKTGAAAGFSSVKTMALISQTATYDTFLANTKAGALYTIHIPTTAPMKPIVKVVRRTTWQAFDSMVIEKCGQSGTLLLGIDKDTKAGYLYAVGHANGTATVIQGLGKVPVTFDDPVYFRRALPFKFQVHLFGE